MNKYLSLPLIFLLFACGGGGGNSNESIPDPIAFSLNIGLTSFSLDEDSQYSGSLSATANESVTLDYALISSSTNGELVFSSSGEIMYTPNPNFFGTDQFEYSVTAIEKSVTKNATVNITINSVNDVPDIGF